MTSFIYNITVTPPKKTGHRNTRDRDEWCQRMEPTEEVATVFLRLDLQKAVWEENLDAGNYFLHKKWAASAPEATHWLCGFLGNNHPQECRACPSVVGGPLPRCFSSFRHFHVLPANRVGAKDLSFNLSNFMLMPFYSILNNMEFMSCAIPPQAAWMYSHFRTLIIAITSLYPQNVLQRAAGTSEELKLCTYRGPCSQQHNS